MTKQKQFTLMVVRINKHFQKSAFEMANFQEEESA